MADRTVIAQGKNFRAFSDGTFVVENVQASYSNVFVPRDKTDTAGNPTGKKQFSQTGLIPKGPTHSEFIKWNKGARQKMLNENSPIKLDAGKDYKMPIDRQYIADGDDSNKEEQADRWLLKTAEQTRPIVRLGSQLLSHEDPDDVEKVYSGMWCDMLVRPYYLKGRQKTPTDQGYPDRLLCGLVAVKFRIIAPAGFEHVRFGRGQMDTQTVNDSFSDDHDTEATAGDDDDI